MQFPRQVPPAMSLQLIVQGIGAFVQSSKQSEASPQSITHPPLGQVTLQSDALLQLVAQLSLMQLKSHSEPEVQTKLQLECRQVAVHSVPTHVATAQPVSPQSNSHPLILSHEHSSGQSTSTNDPPLLVVPVLPLDEESPDTVGGV